VYATDARESDGVRVAAVAPAESHAPVVYPVAVVKGSRNVAAARAFVTFLAEIPRAAFRPHGFTMVALIHQISLRCGFSLETASAATALAFVLGIAAAGAMHRYRGPGGASWMAC